MKPERWVVSKTKSLQAGGGVEGGCVEAQECSRERMSIQLEKKLQYKEKT